MSQNTRLYELFGVAPDSTLETITTQYNNLRKYYDAESNTNEGVMSFQSYDQCGDGTSYVFDSASNTNLNESETVNVPLNTNDVLDSASNTNLNESETANLLLNMNDPHWIENNQSSEINDQTLIATDPSLQTNNPVTSEISNNVANTNLEHINQSSTNFVNELSLYDEFWKFQIFL
ncbi:hypothetical protein WA158_005960 [Blastocystis sp. Blastoise]